MIHSDPYLTCMKTKPILNLVFFMMSYMHPPFQIAKQSLYTCIGFKDMGIKTASLILRDGKGSCKMNDNHIKVNFRVNKMELRGKYTTWHL